jgi:hypothetical protein
MMVWQVPLALTENILSNVQARKRRIILNALERSSRVLDSSRFLVSVNESVHLKV